MGGLLGNTKVARRGSGPGSPQCDAGNVPVYQCRDYSRGYPRTVVSSLPCHMGPPPGGYHDPYHYPAALPNANQDVGYGEEAENWSESTLVYFGVGLVTIAILSKFIQDLLRSPQPRAPRVSSPKKATIFSPPEERVGAGGETESLLSMKDLFYGEPETVVILKTDDRKVIDNIHQYKYYGLLSEDSKGPKSAEPVKSEGKKKQKGEKKDEARKDESKKNEAKQEEGKKEDPPKDEGKAEEKKDEAKPEEKKEEGKSDEKKEEAKPEDKKEEAAPAAEARKEEKKDGPTGPPTREILLRVPMCCTECELTAAEALRELAGVTDVQCDYHEERVTVTVVGDVQAPDLLLKCRSLKLFRKSEYWK